MKYCKENLLEALSMAESRGILDPEVDFNYLLSVIQIIVEEGATTPIFEANFCFFPHEGFIWVYVSTHRLRGAYCE